MSNDPNRSVIANATVLMLRAQKNCMYIRESFNLTRNETYLML